MENPTGIIGFMLTIFGPMLIFLEVPSLSWCFLFADVDMKISFPSDHFWDLQRGIVCAFET
jgi:hypothetical protein